MKNKWTLFFLCLFLGPIGAHKFYEGKVGMGLLYLFTFGLFGIGWIVDLIAILVKPDSRSSKAKAHASSDGATRYAYVGSKDSNKFHSPFCPYAEKIPQNKQIWFKSKADAEAHGYKVCEKCWGYLSN